MDILRTVSQSQNGFTGNVSPLYHLRAENIVSINFAISIIIVYKFIKAVSDDLHEHKCHLKAVFTKC